MIKKLFAVVLTAVSLISLTACSKEELKVTEISANENMIVIAGHTKEIKLNYQFNRETDKDIEQEQAISNCALKFGIDDESIATVDENGNVTGVSKGDTVIVVKTEDASLYATINVKVLEFGSNEESESESQESKDSILSDFDFENPFQKETEESSGQIDTITDSSLITAEANTNIESKENTSFPSNNEIITFP